MTFRDYINTLHETIRFTLETEFTSVYFLDVHITMGVDKFILDLYTKPTDVNSALDATSFHPQQTIGGLPYSQMLRVKRIVSDPIMAEDRLKELKNKFLERS